MITFIPNGRARRAAAKALADRMKLPPSRRYGTDVGVTMAKRIASGKPVSANKVAKFFPRFEGRYVLDKSDGKNNLTSATIGAWNLWGGDAARRQALAALRKGR